MAKYTKKPPVTRIPFYPKFPPSPEQVEIFSHIKLIDGPVHVGAVAGSGKSTTIVWEMRNAYMRNSRERAKFMAFNKDIVEAIEPNCASNVDVSTAHASGNRMLYKRFGRVFMPMDKNKNPTKVKTILKGIAPKLFDPDMAGNKEKGEVYSRMYDTCKLIDMLRLTLTDECNPGSVMDIMTRYNIDIDKWQEIIVLLPDIFDAIIKDPAVIDFVDMMWLPVRLNLPFDTFDVLYLDEVQDFNMLMIEYSKRMVREEGRILSVGDRNQSIYGFSGAATNSIDVLCEAFSSKELPLNTCYRCGRNIVELAQTIVPEIMPFEGSLDGVVDRPEKLEYNMPDGSMVLSRRNANLVKPCFELIRQGRKAIIKGRDIGANLVNTINKHKGATLDETVDNIAEYTYNRVAKLQEKKDSGSAIDAVQDTYEVVKYIAMECKTTDEMVSRIENIFSEKTKGITLSSIHRSKGLEAPHVTIVDYGRVRLSNDKMTEDDHRQERNLQYVALTRAKHQLDLIY